jgi:hypothetical protein
MNFGYTYLPAEGSRGGILVAWRLDRCSGARIVRSQHAIKLMFTCCTSGSSWWLASVYVPRQDTEKVLFLDELRGLRPPRDEPWFLCATLFTRPQIKATQGWTYVWWGNFTDSYRTWSCPSSTFMTSSIHGAMSKITAVWLGGGTAWH